MLAGLSVLYLMACGTDGEPAAELASIDGIALAASAQSPDQATPNDTIALSRSLVDFGTVGLHQRSGAEELVTITNRGATALVLPAYIDAPITPSGNPANRITYRFDTSPTPCPMDGESQASGLAPGASCILSFAIDTAVEGLETQVWSVAASAPFSITFKVTVLASP